MNRSHTFPILGVLLAIAAGYIGAGTEDTRETRAVMFAVVAFVFAAELTSMVARTKRDQWDGLAVSMALVRFAVVHYFGMLALEFGGIAQFPAPYWTAARTMLGVFGCLAFLYMVREDLRAYRELTWAQRGVMSSMLLVLSAYFLSIALIW